MKCREKNSRKNSLSDEKCDWKKRVDLSDKAKIKVRSTSPWSEFSPRAFWAASLIIHLDCQEIWLVGAVG